MRTIDTALIFLALALIVIASACTNSNITPNSNQITGNSVENQNGINSNDNSKIITKTSELTTTTNTATPLSKTSTTIPSVTSSPTKIIQMQELQSHNNDADCWVSFRGKVYDITSFLPLHPGTPAKIIPYCGTSTEFENTFLAKHGESKISVLKSQGIYLGEFSN